VISICYVVDAAFLGGAELYVSRLATALDRRRFAPWILARAGVADPRLAAWGAELRRMGLEVETLPMRLPFRPAHAVGIWNRLEERGPRIVHVNMPGPYDGQMGLVVPIARAAGARTVVTEHLPMVGRLWKRAGVKALAYRCLDAAVTMTRCNAEYLVNRQGVSRTRVHVVANGVGRDYGRRGRAGVVEREALGIEPGVVVVGYVGNILLHKGLYRVIQALSEVSAPPWHLLVVGDGPDEFRCQARVEEAGLSERASFLGARAPSEVEAILSACDVLALPSEIEGLPYTVLEAMACGLPVVAGRVYGLPEAVEDGVTGILVDPLRVDEIRAALEALLGDPLLRARMGRAARARFERDFTLEQQVARMERLYENLSRGRAHGEPEA
jgi:glycosyltransferase involved in cell wall biosynthesis